MTEEEKRGLRIFLLYSTLIAALAAYNLYTYVRVGGALSLIIGIVGAAILVGWVIFYFLYVQKSPPGESSSSGT